ncbi:type II secretion system protein GspM [Brevundimonas sp.]|uniref:type II secretion system protein GspM n=1 Tax=Brevundimonas sp. TaxID=1871086 RepID=UPI002AB89028|nr:type II secretion system protein GspM [Brevundimonas sp.]MDZ4364987.1 type II secretion system protein GspM [Brevundimonas sp.]
MKAMIEQTRTWWTGRSPRERAMLSVMGGLIAAVALWFLVVSPTLTWRSEATERRAEASAQRARIEAGVARMQGSSGTTMAVSDMEQVASQTATAASLNVAFAPEDGGLGFTVTQATTGALFGWLALLQAEHGMAPRTLVVSENADATLSAQGVFAGG